MIGSARLMWGTTVAERDPLERLDPDLVLAVIAARPCEHTRSRPPGACLRDGRSPLAMYGAYRACDPCTAWAALADSERERIPVTESSDG